MGCSQSKATNAKQAGLQQFKQPSHTEPLKAEIETPLWQPLSSSANDSGSSNDLPSTNVPAPQLAAVTAPPSPFDELDGFVEPSSTAVQQQAIETSATDIQFKYFFEDTNDEDDSCLSQLFKIIPPAHTMAFTSPARKSAPSSWRSELTLAACSVVRHELFKAREELKVKSILKKQAVVVVTPVVAASSPKKRRNELSEFEEKEVHATLSIAVDNNQEEKMINIDIEEKLPAYYSPLKRHASNNASAFNTCLEESNKKVIFDQAVIRATAPKSHKKKNHKSKSLDAELPKTTLTKKQQQLMESQSRSKGRSGPVASKWDKGGKANMKNDIYTHMLQAFERQLTNVNTMDAHLDTR